MRSPSAVGCAVLGEHESHRRNREAGDPSDTIMNANLKAAPGAMLGGIGPMWGTWKMANWEGTFEGGMTEDGSIYHAQGNRTGPYRGMKQWVNSDHGILTGRILDPHDG